MAPGNMHSQDTITLTGSPTGDTPAANVTIPRELGPVRLLREIGRGGMGVVYLGRHQMLDRDVAVKFLLNAVAGPIDPGFAGFLDGARAAARLEHPGLTTIHHADVVDGIPYLVMQYIDGLALSEVLKQTGPLSLSILFAVLDAVSEAIGELHDRGIIHRDIKPGNVLLSHDGRVVVTDFGLALARPLGQRGPSSAGLAGTPAYMAPEMFAGEVSLRSDVYALGIMTFELLTGELPFTGAVEEVRQKHLHEPLPLDPLQRCRLDPAMIEVLQRATHKNAMFRYKTAEYLRKALQGSIAKEELLREGAAELHRLVPRALDKELDATTTEAAGTTPTSTYFDRLAEIAEAKRAMRELSDKGDAHEPTQEDREEPPPLPPDDEPVEVGSIPGPPSTEPAPASWPASAAALVADVPCAKCDYNLRGLSASGRCPECGEPIASSLRPDRLLFANPDWLRHIVRGLRVLYFAVPVWLLLFNLVVGPVLLVLSPNRKGALALARDVAVVVLIVGLVLGFFFATAAEPRRYSASIRWRTRRVARTLGILIPLLLPAIAFTASYSRVLFIVSQGLICVALLGMIVTFLLYLASLVDRIPDARLARRSRVSAVLFPAFVTLGVALAFALWALNESPWGYEIGVALSICVVGCAVTVCLIWSLMRLYRKGIKRVIAASVSYETLFGDVPTEVALPTSESDRAPTPSLRAETGDTGGDSTDVDEVPSADDIPCIHCGYNLRGLSEGGRCPECGTAIARSSRGNLLSAADPAWLQRVYRGQVLIATACMMVGVLGFIQGDVSRAGPAAFIEPSLFVGPNTVKSVVSAVMLVAGNLVLLLGAFAVTTLDPRLSLTEQPIVLRRFVRWSITALMVLVGCTYLAPPALKELGVDTELASLCGSAFSYVSAAVFLCGVVGICYYLAGLAMRIPDARLGSRIRSRVIGFVVCLVICPVGTQVLEYGERAFPGTPGVAVIMIVGQGILMLSMCAYMFLLIYIMSYYQKAFRKCLLEARKHAVG